MRGLICHSLVADLGKAKSERCMKKLSELIHFGKPGQGGKERSWRTGVKKRSGQSQYGELSNTAKPRADLKQCSSL